MLSKYITNLAICLLLLSINEITSAQLVDGYPEEIANKLLEQQQAETSSIAKMPNPEAANFLFSNKRWDPGSKILVAFNGGDVNLHRAIEQQAKLWEKYANINFDFGYDPIKNKYRTWSESDAHRVAHIRIGFSEPGYWSTVGTDSISNYGHGERNSASMNFQGFADIPIELLNPRWKYIVIHEFGHALGLDHEHQHPICGKEFRWETGPNGEESVYKIFKDWQGWKPQVVDINLKPKPIKTNSDYMTQIPDKESVMMYAMPAQAFIKGDKSPCFTRVENKNISKLDGLGAKMAYPMNPTEALQTADAYKRAALSLASTPLDGLNDTEKTVVKSRLETALQSRKPLLYIQIHNESDRKEALKIQELARESGFFAPGIENVSHKNLKSGPQIEVRYFRDSDLDSAQQISSLLTNQLGVEKVKILHVKALASTVTRNMVEVWYP
ncbi:hypothetical protein HUN23_17745 [Acinetobacter oleivorans]|uniref:hypothetical protein n=1 Tax=Acinetobacter oleivorans TaxID=1148157 RepID=UPI00158030B5|nr:hypothetical protein [Acinetobacter oleivorans]NUF24601.1 hypothetical protein [Acinetobacter oleivorans]